MDVKIIKGYKPLLCMGEKYFVYHKGKVGLYHPDSDLFEKPISIDFSILGIFASQIRLAERIMRFQPRTAEYIDENTVLFAQRGRIYRVSFQQRTIEVDHCLASGMKAPLNMRRIEGIQGFEDGIYYGEYSANVDKKSVGIYRRLLKDGKWEKIYTFPSGSIHHIHNIVPGNSKDSLYILTGDDDTGSGIWKALDNFSRVIPLAVGSQNYRTCVLFEMGDDIIYCTDSPMRQNYIYRCVRENEKINIVNQYPIPGTCIYGEADDEETVISTTVEPNSIFEKEMSLSNMLENKIGGGISDRFIHIIKGNFKRGFTEIGSAEKDIFPMRLCQFGSAQFPKYSFSKYGKLDIYFEATKGSDDQWHHYF